MNCKNCKFVISSNMKFALMKNICPSCGTALFSEVEQNELSVLQSRINKEDFANNMDKSSVYDVALFIFNEIRNGIGQLYIEKQVKKALTEGREGGDISPIAFKEEVSSSEEKEKIRREIEKEFLPEIESTIVESEDVGYQEEVDEEPFKPYTQRESAQEKSERLKKVYDNFNSSSRKTGPMVKRVS